MLCQTPKKRVADNSVPICKQNPISLLVSFAAAAAATIHHSHRCRTLAVTMFFVCASATTASAFGKLIKKLQFCENAFVSFVYHNFSYPPSLLSAYEMRYQEVAPPPQNPHAEEWWWWWLNNVKWSSRRRRGTFSVSLSIWPPAWMACILKCNLLHSPHYTHTKLILEYRRFTRPENHCC